MIMHNPPTKPPHIPVFASDTTADRIETNTHVIHLKPRISAAKLAEYVVADPSRQETIVKNAKRAQKAIFFPYGQVRSALPRAFSPGGLRADFLQQRAAEVAVAPWDTDWKAADNKRSSDALKKLALIATDFKLTNAVLLPHPQTGSTALRIEGVRVSVWPEVIFSVAQRGLTKVGGIILNTGQNESLSLDRGNGRHTVADYLTVLLYRMLETHLKSEGTPSHTKCFAVDIFRSKIHAAPPSHKTLLNHLEAACRIIAMRWESIPNDVSGDEDSEASF